MSMFEPKRIFQFFLLIFAGAGLFLFFSTDNKISIDNLANLDLGALLPMETKNKVKDIELQKPLRESLPAGMQAPQAIKAVYSTAWSASSEKKINYFIKLIKDTELNAIVIDIKDYSGNLSYDTDVKLAEKYGAEKELKILKPNELIKKFHDAGIYVIARQTVFQDPILALARPDLALTSSSTGKQWTDNKKVMWMDSASKEVWDYNIEIAKDILARGFDEVNFDYIRFASDGNMDDIKYPVWDGKTYKRTVMKNFFKYVRQALPDAKLSADMFGLVTLNYGDVGIGQNLDDALNYFDAIAPMVYPSHYQKGFNGFQNPADYPYEVVYKSMLEANKRLNIYKSKAQNSTSTEIYLVKNPQIRPWLQDFDLGATYDAAKVRAQIDATYASATGTPVGWMLWDPSNSYTATALQEDNN